MTCVLQAPQRGRHITELTDRAEPRREFWGAKQPMHFSQDPCWPWLDGHLSRGRGREAQGSGGPGEPWPEASPNKN